MSHRIKHGLSVLLQGMQRCTGKVLAATSESAHVPELLQGFSIKPELTKKPPPSSVGPVFFLWFILFRDFLFLRGRGRGEGGVCLFWLFLLLLFLPHMLMFLADQDGLLLGTEVLLPQTTVPTRQGEVP